MAFLIYVRSTSIQSFADANNSNITRLFMPMSCGYEKGIGRRERKNGKTFLVNRLGHLVKFGEKIKILSLSLVEIGVRKEKNAIGKAKIRLLSNKHASLLRRSIN
jgi:hypothetical protein